MWEAAAIGAVANIAGGLLGGNSAKKAAAEQNRRYNEAYKAAAAHLPQAYNWSMANADKYNQMAANAPGNWAFHPVTSRNVFGSTAYDPATQQYSTTLSPEYDAAKGMFSRGFQGVNNQLGEFDPSEFANSWYNQQQGLLAPTRENQLEKLTQRMFKAGALGVTNNVAGQDGVTPVNPYASTLANVWGQQDAQLAANAENMGQTRLDQLIGRQRGLWGDVVGVDQLGQTAFDQSVRGQQMAAPFMLGGMSAQQALQQQGMLQEQAAQNFWNNFHFGNWNAVNGANPGGMNTAGMGDQINSGMWQSLGSSIAGLPWQQVINGMFGGGGVPYGGNSWASGGGYNPYN